MANEFQAMKFIKLDFRGAWKRVLLADGVMEYQALAKTCVLLAVQEGATGLMVTHHFRVPGKEVVYVIAEVVHIPARCGSKDYGDTVPCP